ncbi:anti-sigma factor antagonist [Actinomadura parmotrematis]|uniref:Anti-sigma factor antagonist n=1 Tax=Actinomadura parmotrematis TaxID=2864039 RepID=A0ABS7FT96_9ACTN|nr:anti-sigma factor antagonist [Actinomadura parmotrematis]MBW8483628.1 anti-sigma factor antagonist [Actinomadura parmotrematis]
MTPLQIDTRTAGGVTVVALAGELDLGASARADDAVRAAQADAAHPHLVLDLHALDFMDSAGLNVLITAYRRAAAAGRYLALCGLRPDTARVLDIAGLRAHFTVHDTLDAALAGAPAH